MAVNKNFIIRNGLEVDESLIFADADTQKVGIGTTAPHCELTVVGKMCADTAEFTGIVTASGFFQGAILGTDIVATNLSVSGISTLNDVEINGLLTVGGTTGQQDYYLANTGAGITWAPFRENVIDTFTITATEGQSLFSVDYTIGLVEVYLNGVRLTDSEFSAINGSTVTLIDPAFGGDNLDFVRYSNAFDFFQFGDISIDTTGIISATSFYGDGSNLTGLSADVSAKVAVVDSDAATDHYLTFVDSNNDPTADDEIVYSDVDLTYKPSTSTLSVGGRIGVNTSTASQTLDVNGNARFRGAIYDNNNLDGDTDDVFVSTGAGVTWKDLSSIINDSNLNTTGIITANSFDGDGSGLTGVVTSITTGSGIGIDTTTGNVTITSTVWEEYPAGISTSLNVGIGTTNATSTLTVDGGFRFAGEALENVNITAGTLLANQDINLADGMVHYFTTNETGISTANIRIDGSTSLDSRMDIGNTAAVEILITPNNAGYSTCINIDGSFNDVKWLNGTDPTTGSASGIDAYTYQIIKTASNTFTVLGDVNNFA
jgi:hypothetical protein